MARKDKWASQRAIDRLPRDESGLVLTAKDAAFLNRIRQEAQEADRKAQQGRNGAVYLPMAAWKRLEKLAGRNRKVMLDWEALMLNPSPEGLNKYPFGTERIRSELTFIRQRVRKGVADKQKQKQEQKERSNEV